MIVCFEFWKSIPFLKIVGSGSRGRSRNNGSRRYYLCRMLLIIDGSLQAELHLRLLLHNSSDFVSLLSVSLSRSCCC